MLYQPETKVHTFSAHSFKSIILLSTRCPGLRKFFVEYTLPERISQPNASLEMRPMDHDERTPEWGSTLSLAIFRLLENTLAALVEETKPSLLGGMNELNSGCVDSLLFQFYS